MSNSKRKRDSAGSNATAKHTPEKAHATGGGGGSGSNSASKHKESRALPPPMERDNNSFEVSWVGGKAVKPAKRRKLANKDSTEPREEPGIEGTSNMGGWFTVKPASYWNQLSKYRNFVVNPRAGTEEYDELKHKFQLGDFIFVNHQTEAQDGAASDDERQNWVAQVREVRAASPDAVFVRVIWMYWPEELPSGKQTYHGDKELVASNLMDIIDAMTVDGKAKVVRLRQSIHDKDRDHGTFGHLQPDTYYWRQTFNASSSKLSSLPRDCECRQISNLDEPMYQCPNSDCGRWFHEHCLEDAALRQYWNQLRSRTEKDRAPNGESADGAEGANGVVGPEESDMGDTIIASPMSGKLKGTKSFFSSLLLGFSGTPADSAVESNGRGPATTRPGRGGRRQKSSSRPGSGPKTKAAAVAATAAAAAAAARSGSGVPLAAGLKVMLVVEDGRFTGRAKIYRTDADPGDADKEDPPLLDTIDVLCLSDKCGKSMAEQTRFTKVVDAAKSRFDAVKDALENSVSENKTTV